MMSSLKKPTKTEVARFHQILGMWCSACAAIGIQNFHMLEVHHLLAGNRRIGHVYTVCLCAGHHRSVWVASQKVILLPSQLVSIADGRKAFSAVYGTERKLWEKTEFLLGRDPVWPTSKILPRRAA